MPVPLQCQKPRGDARSSGEKPIQVRPIPLAAATCQKEQIEFVFLRWLVEALNSVLVALLIKAVKANRVSSEPRRPRSASDNTACRATVIAHQD